MQGSSMHNKFQFEINCCFRFCIFFLDRNNRKPSTWDNRGESPEQCNVTMFEQHEKCSDCGLWCGSVVSFLECALSSSLSTNTDLGSETTSQ